MLALALAGCTGSAGDLEAIHILADVRAALDDVKSFRMDTEFAMPLDGSGQLTSVSVIWASPDRILTLARGNGDPGFQQVYQEGGACLARYGEDEEWEEMEVGCAEAGQVRPTFRTWLEMENPDVVSEVAGVALVRGKNVNGDGSSNDEPPLIAFWELDVDTATSLIKGATGYAEDGVTPLVTVRLTGYNDSFESDFDSLNLPEDSHPPSS